jgi:CRISPR system Cascade subunit CasA
LTAGVGRWSTSDRVRWYREGLPAQTLVDYLERWRERFWLFHSSQPFMQVAAIGRSLPAKASTRFAAAGDRAAGPMAVLEAKPWTQIALESVSGNNPVVFDHSSDEAPLPITPQQALRLMLAYLQYTPGQPVKALCKSGNDLSGPVFNSASVIPVGRTLAQSLILGLPAAPLSDGIDLPSWEQAAPELAHLLGAATLATGPCDRYTRQTRALLLLREPSGSVSRLRFAEGRALLDDPNAPDPMSSFRPGTDGWVRLTFNAGRAVWRDLASLVPDSSGKLARPAAILDGAIALHAAAGLWDDEVELVVAGLAAKQGKMLRARLERFRIPRGVLGSADAAAATRDALRRCEDLHAALRQLAALQTAYALPDPNHKDTRAHARDIVAAGPLAASFFSTAERNLPGLLRAIGSDDIEGAHALWSAALLRSAQVAWQAAGDALGESAAALRARARMHDRFQQLIRPLRSADAGAAASSNLHEAELTP